PVGDRRRRAPSLVAPPIARALGDRRRCRGLSLRLRSRRRMEIVDGTAVRVRGVGGAANDAGCRFARRAREAHGLARVGARTSGDARRSSGDRNRRGARSLPRVSVGARLWIVVSAPCRLDRVLPAIGRGGEGTERVAGVPAGGVKALELFAEAGSNNFGGESPE